MPRTSRAGEKSEMTLWIDSEVSQAFINYVIKRYGSRYRHLGLETEKAISMYLGVVDTQQAFTLPSNAIQLGRDVRRRLNAVIGAISKAVTEYDSTRISHGAISEIIKFTTGRKDKRTIDRYLNLLLQNGMGRTTEADGILYDVAGLRAHDANNCGLTINSTDRISGVEDARQHLQHEDFRKPETRSDRLRGE